MEIKVRPTRRAFVIRYLIYPYYLIAGLIMLFWKDLSLLHESDYLLYLLIWGILTVLPGLILAFKRRKFSWFFWPLALNLLGWGSQFVFKSEDYAYYVKNGPYLAFIAVSVVAVIFIELYRISIRYTISTSGIEITSGIFGANNQLIVNKHITNVLLKRNFLEMLLGVGHVIPVTSSGMGAGDTGVIGGFTGSAGVKGANVGGFVGKTSSVKEFVADPRNCIYGVPNPRKIMEEVKKNLTGQSA
ncbi:membrane protein [Kosmotoga arenicorallina S304]|uniref:Membrane protein n=1 Tax=Kosmotoga arenicorallina S304 TaxID=1453497 RepID=A0A176K0T0_9BACT|nr:PH domain-containing protein [Kosmotoga arenicorallina]OAA30407.1 membrane protein [Kosmotoga arenicorallina S304]